MTDDPIRSQFTGASSETAPTPPTTPQTMRSEDLLQGQRELLIIHAHEVYRLRLTRNGKLILTK